MTKTQLEQIAKVLDGLTLAEWSKLKVIVEENIFRKRQELERTLKLSSEELQQTTLPLSE